MSLLPIAYLLIHATSVLIGFLAAVISFKRYTETRIPLILLMVLLCFGFAFVNANLLVPLFFPDVDFEIIAAIHTVTLAIIFTFAILFFNAFEGDLSVIKTSTAACLSGIVAFLTVTGLLYDFSILGVIYSEGEVVTFVWSPLPAAVFTVSGLLVGLWGYQHLTISLKYATNWKQLRQIKIMRIGITVMVFGTTAVVIPGYILTDLGEVELGTWLAMVLAWVPMATGFALLAITYLSSKEVAFLQPQRVDSLIVIHESGLPLFEHDFRSGPVEKEVELFSGAITAVKTLLAEAFGVTTDIERIVFKDRHILLVVKKHVAFILITERTTVFLKNALATFANRFYDRYRSSIASFTGDLTEYSLITPEMMVIFGLTAD